mgnify:FL=1|jgi:hypothetical protein
MIVAVFGAVTIYSLKQLILQVSNNLKMNTKKYDNNNFINK